MYTVSNINANRNSNAFNAITTLITTAVKL